MAKSDKKEEVSEQKVAPQKDKKQNKQNKQNKDKKPNVFVRMGRKLKETFSELKRVTWPSFGKALKATGIVLAIVLVFTVIVTGVNYGFSELLEFITSWGGKA